MEVLEALNTALTREQEGQRFYDEAATKAANAKGRHMFEWLADEETGHIRMLEEAIRDFTENDSWLTRDMWGSSKHTPEPIHSSKFPSKPEVMGDIPVDAAEMKILEKAIEAEKLDAAYYDGTAQQIDDPNGKIMMEKLVHFEKGHLALLQEEYDWIKHSKDMFTVHRFLRASRPFHGP